MSSSPTVNPIASQRSGTPPSNSSVHPLIQQVPQSTAGNKPGSKGANGKELANNVSGKPKNAAKKAKSEMDELIRDKSKLLPEGYKDMRSLQEYYETQKIARKKRELQRWEWREHMGRINCIVITSDNKYIITGSIKDFTIKMYDVETKEVWELANEGLDHIVSLSLSKDNRYLASYSSINSLRIFDLTTKKVIAKSDQLHPESDNNIWIAFLKDSNKVLVTTNSTIKTYDWQKKEISQFRGLQKGALGRMAVSRDGNYLAVVSGRTSLKIFDLSTEEEISEFSTQQQDGIAAIAISPDNKFIATSSFSSIKVFDFKSKQELYEFEYVHKSRITLIVISSNNRYLISGSEDNFMKVFDLYTKQEIYRFLQCIQTQITTIAVANDDEFVAVCSSDGYVRLVDIGLRQKLSQFKVGEHSINAAIAVSKDNKYIIAGALEGNVTAYDMQTKQIVQNYKERKVQIMRLGRMVKSTPIAPINSVIISNDNKYIVAAGNDKAIEMFDMETKAEVLKFENVHQRYIPSIAMSKDDKYIVSGSWDGSFKVFDTKIKQEVWNMPNAHEGAKITAITITGDARYIISGSITNSIKVWDFQSRQEVFNFKDPHSWPLIASLIVTSDNKYLISASENFSIKIWDLETKQEIHHFTKNQTSRAFDSTTDSTFEMSITEHKFKIALSQDNKYVVALLDEDPMQIYDLHAKGLLHKFSPDEKIDLEQINLTKSQSVTISPDNKSIVVGSRDGSIKIYQMPHSEPNEMNFVSSQIPAYSIIGQYDDMLFGMEDAQSREQFLTSYQDLYILPHRWTLLHLMAVLKPSEVGQVAVYSKYKMPFLVDSYGKTPLHYIIAHDNLDYSAANVLLKYIVEYMEDVSTKDNYQYQTICSSLTDLYPFIISKATPKLAQKYLKLCLSQSPTRFGEKLQGFGIAESKHIFCNTQCMDPKIESKIYTEGQDQVAFRSTMLRLDYDATSDDMLKSMKLLTNTQDEGIFKTPFIEHLIDHLWGNTISTMTAISALFSVLMILLSIYIGLGERELGLEIVILIMTVLFIGLEIVQMYGLKAKYFKNVWNWIDIAHLSLVVVFIILRFADNEDYLAQQWIASTIIIVGYVRWVSYLRLFTPTRILIQIIMAVLYDMLGFVAILCAIVIGFSLIFLTFNRTQDDSQEYPVHLYGTYKILYGDTDDSDYSLSQKLLLSLVLFFLNVVLLNLLISIMGDSYGNVQENKVLIDSKTRLDMILEAAVVKKTIVKGTAGKGYLIYCEPEKTNGDDGQDNEWEERAGEIKEMLRDNERNLNEIKGKLEGRDMNVSVKPEQDAGQMRSDIVEMKRKMDANEREIVQMKERMGALEKMMMKNHEELLGAIKAGHQKK